MRPLYGREDELAVLRAALDTSRTGRSATAVVTGEPGIGKTTLLNALVRDQLSETLVLRVVGVESEAEIAYAALHLLLRPLIGQIDSLPVPQQAALRAAMGLADGTPPNRFHVGLAVLTLLTDAATEQPVLCIVDDAHLVDPESLDAMTFACRRIFVDRVSIIFASRRTELPAALVGFDRRELDGLDAEPARRLLATFHPTGLDDAAAQWLVDQAAGNPLVLCELGQAMSADELNRRSTEPRPLPAVEAAMVRFEQILARLPEPARDLLLVLAADERGDSHVLTRAAAELGTDLDVLDEPDVAGLLNVDGDQFAFRHPLIRSACYQAASRRSRLRAHGILAAIIDESIDIERHAWHRSLASSPPDDRVADVLKAAARRAGRRGATRSQIELLVRSAEFREDPFERGRGFVVAGGAAMMIADTTRMADMAERARAASADPFLAAEVGHLEALGPVFDRHFGAASTRLLDAARELDRIDRDRAREVLLESLFMMMGSTTFTDGLTGDQLARAMIEMPKTSPGPLSTTDLLLDGFATVIVDGWGPGAPMLREAVRRWPDEVLSATAIHRQYGPAIWAAVSLWDQDGLRLLLASSIAVTRAAGALTPLRSLLVEQAKLEASCGMLNRADATASEIDDLSTILDVEANWWSIVAANTLALRGGEASASAAIVVLRQMGEQDGHGHAVEQSLLAEAVLANGNRRYADAAGAASQVAFDRLSLCGAPALVELAEALARIGDTEALADVVAATDERASASGTDLAQGAMLRARALAADDGDADELFRASLDSLSRTQAAPLAARTHLVYGEWLRRQNRRLDARQHLRDAYRQLSTMGLEAFAERARSELLATGEHVLRHENALTGLTPQERQVAILARDGQTNKEIGSQLFISAATVDYHLRKVYRKLGAGNRRELKTLSLD